MSNEQTLTICSRFVWANVQITEQMFANHSFIHSYSSENSQAWLTQIIHIREYYSISEAKTFVTLMCFECCRPRNFLSQNDDYDYSSRSLLMYVVVTYDDGDDVFLHNQQH